MARIFISYARKDGSDVAEELADRLRAFEHDVFLDVHNIRAGTRWRFELRRRITWSQLMIVLVTPASNESEHVRNEINLAESINRPVLPIQIGDTPLPDHLRSEWQGVKMEANNYDRVLLEIEQTLRRLPVRPMTGVVLLGLVLAAVIVGGAFLVIQNQNGGPQNVSLTPLSTLSQPTVVEDFEDSAADGWIQNWGNDFTIIDDGTGNHVWRTSADGEVSYKPSELWQDYAIELDYQIVSWDTEADTGIVLGLRRQTIRTCSRYDFILEPDALVMGAPSNTCENYNFFGQIGYSNVPGDWHTIRIQVSGNQFQFWLDNGETDSFRDDTYSKGSFGILNLYDTEVWFDNLRLWSLD